jgi:hypothetical protein
MTPSFVLVEQGEGSRAARPAGMPFFYCSRAEKMLLSL